MLYITCRISAVTYSQAFHIGSDLIPYFKTCRVRRGYVDGAGELLLSFMFYVLGEYVVSRIRKLLISVLLIFHTSAPITSVGWGGGGKADGAGVLLVGSH